MYDAYIIYTIHFRYISNTIFLFLLILQGYCDHMVILRSHDITQERIILPEISDNNNRLNCIDYITLYTLELLRYNKIYTQAKKSSTKNSSQEFLKEKLKQSGIKAIKFINGGRK